MDVIVSSIRCKEWLRVMWLAIHVLGGKHAGRAAPRVCGERPPMSDGARPSSPLRSPPPALAQSIERQPPASMQGAPVAAATGGPQAQPRPDLLGEVAVDVLCWKCGGAGERLRKVKRPRKASRRSVEAGTDAAAPAVAAEATAALALVAHTCTVCGGSGRLGSGSAHHAPALPRKVRPTKVLEGWDPPGPAPVGEQGDPELREGPAEELCYLLGQWRIFQPLKGHRYSTDDVVTAWCARAWCTALRKPVRRAMDIGCGIGSVLLMTAWLFPDARCDGVEAQAERYHLARRSVRYNLGAGCDRVRVQNGDLRCAEPPAGGGGFDLVTGTPPYWDVAVGGLPQTMGRARCLFEFFGGIEDYCATAARLLAPDGAPRCARCAPVLTCFARPLQVCLLCATLRRHTRGRWRQRGAQGCACWRTWRWCRGRVGRRCSGSTAWRAARGRAAVARRRAAVARPVARAPRVVVRRTVDRWQLMRRQQQLAPCLRPTPRLRPLIQRAKRWPPRPPRSAQCPRSCACAKRMARARRRTCNCCATWASRPARDDGC